MATPTPSAFPPARSDPASARQRDFSGRCWHLAGCPRRFDERDTEHPGWIPVVIDEVSGTIAPAVGGAREHGGVAPPTIPFPYCDPSFMYLHWSGDWKDIDEQLSQREPGMTIVLDCHPAYNHLRRVIQRAEPTSVIELPAPDRLPQPDNRALAGLIERGMLIIRTIVRCTDPSPSALRALGEMLPPSIAPAVLDAVDDKGREYSVSPFHLYPAEVWPSKNVGELLFLRHGDEEEDLPRIVHPERVGLPIPVIAVDGIIGAGKTTFMKRKERSAIGGHFEGEDVEAIYDTIRYCSENKITGSERRRLIEDTIARGETRFLSDLPSLATHICIERNWIYARWVFGDYDSPSPILPDGTLSPTEFPTVDEEIVLAFEQSRARFAGTVLLRTLPETAVEWTKARGTNDEIDAEFERRLEERLKLLFDSPYEWAYGRLITEEEFDQHLSLLPLSRPLL